MDEKRRFIQCAKCGKNLIERLPNGLWKFVFGKKAAGHRPPVIIYIHGSLKMQCLRSSCEHWNVLNYLPQSSDGTPIDPPKVEQVSAKV